jgi:hypothetical protein
MNRREFLKLCGSVLFIPYLPKVPERYSAQWFADELAKVMQMPAVVLTETNPKYHFEVSTMLADADFAIAPEDMCVFFVEASARSLERALQKYSIHSLCLWEPDSVWEGIDRGYRDGIRATLTYNTTYMCYNLTYDIMCNDY